MLTETKPVSETLKPCPFCGRMPLTKEAYGGTIVIGEIDDCPCRRAGYTSLVRWNTRFESSRNESLEIQALHAKIKQLNYDLVFLETHLRSLAIHVQLPAELQRYLKLGGG